MMVWTPKRIPIALHPGTYCVNCIDPHHPEGVCWMLEMHNKPDGSFAIEPCGCDNSFSPNAPGRYVVRVTEIQKE